MLVMKVTVTVNRMILALNRASAGTVLPIKNHEVRTSINKHGRP